MQKSYNVIITEPLTRVVTVDAESAEAAEQLVREQHEREEIVLDSSDFVGVEFEVESAESEPEPEKVEPTIQERADKLVSREVFCHVGGLIEELNTATDSQFFFDNFNYDPSDEAVKEEAENHDETDMTDSALEEARDRLRDEWEPLEYWAVSEWLKRKLEEQGEVVANIGLTNVWARTTSGQAIAIDYVIEKIVESTDYAKFA